LYDDVNISLKDVEPADKQKGDVEMTVAGQVNVNQEGACNHVKDDAQATLKIEAIPKKERKFKKPASPSKKQTLGLEDKPTKKPSRKKIVGVVIRDTLGMSMSKKKAQAKVDRGKRMYLISDVALLKAAQLKKVLKKSKEDTHMFHTNGSDDGFPIGPKIHLRVKTHLGGDCDNNDNDSNDDVDDDKDIHESDDDHDEDDDEWTKSDHEEEEKQDDEFVHTPDDYVPTDDEKNDESKEFDEKEYEELYDDVNISLKDVEPADKQKGDVEMTVAGQVNVNQEGACNHVKDDAQATLKIEGPIPSSSISADYAAKYLNFDNIPLVDTEVVLMLDINVQHEVPPTTSTTVVSESETLAALHQRITNLEKDIKELKTIDSSITLLSTIKSEVPNAIKEYLRTSLNDALHKELHKHSADITKEHSVLAKIVERLR
nr:hypothetical protein [Tanacetum cinerariifolium]